MKTLVQQVPLYDRKTEVFADAGLYDQIDEKNVADVERHWKPLLDQAVEKLRAAGNLTVDSLGAIDAQDSHWEWREKAAVRTSPLRWRSFAIECEGLTQGLMFAELAKFGRAPQQRGREIVYVDLLSSAPWNRKRFTAEPRFGQIGRILLATAISLSLDEQFEGRVGLHSLPQSEVWYRDRCQMTDLGVDTSGSHRGLRYFEMTEVQARTFLA